MIKNQPDHNLTATRLKQTKSSQRIILRASVTGTMGLKTHEQRRNGNPFVILVSIEDLRSGVDFSLQRTISGADLARPPNEKTHRL